MSAIDEKDGDVFLSWNRCSVLRISDRNQLSWSPGLPLSPLRSGYSSLSASLWPNGMLLGRDHRREVRRGRIGRVLRHIVAGAEASIIHGYRLARDLGRRERYADQARNSDVGDRNSTESAKMVQSWTRF